MVADRSRQGGLTEISSQSHGGPLRLDWFSLDKSVRVGEPIFKLPLNYFYVCEREVLEVAQALAVLGEYGSLRTLAEVAGTTTEAVDEALTTLTSVGLLEHGRFRHAVAERAALASIPAQRISSTYLGAAMALRAVGAPAVDVARRLVAGDYTDATWTSYLMQEAAPQALALNDRELVVRILRLALRGVADPAHRARILTRIAEMYAATDPELCSQNLHEAGALVATDELWLTRCQLFGEQMARRGEAAAALDRIATTASRIASPTPVQLIDLETERLLICGDYPWLRHASRSLVEEPDAADEIMDEAPHFGAAWSLVRILTNRQRDPRAVEVAKEALYSCAFTPHASRTALAALGTLIYADESDAVHSFTDKLIDEAEIGHAIVWRARFLAVRAEAALCDGQYADAALAAEHALEEMSPQAWGTRLAGPLASLMLGRVMTGEAMGTKSCLARHLPAATFKTRYGLRYIYARGHVNLVEGRPLAALADFRACGRLMATWGIDHEHVLPWRLAAAGARLALGDLEDAVDLIDERQSHLASEGQRVGAGGHRSAREHVFEILTGAVERRQLIEGVRLLSAKGQVAPTTAGTARYRIEDRFMCGLDKLTPAEQRVAMLAVKGTNNRMIARSLCLSISTVEQHLTRTYKKLGVAGRRELRAKLG